MAKQPIGRRACCGICSGNCSNVFRKPSVVREIKAARPTPSCGPPDLRRAPRWRPWRACPPSVRTVRPNVSRTLAPRGWPLPRRPAPRGRRRLPGKLPRLGSAFGVLVVPGPQGTLVIAPPGGAIEPLVHAPEAVEAARVGRIGVVHDAVLEHERAQARPLA